MNYYEVQFRSMGTGRYLDASLGAGKILKNKASAPPETRIFILRKITDSTEKTFAFENDEAWLWAGNNIFGLTSRTYVFDKKHTFKIIAQPYNTGRVRIMVSDGQLVNLPEGSAEDSSPTLISSDSTRWDDGTVFFMTLSKTKMEVANSNSNAEIPPLSTILDDIRPLDGIKAQFKSAFLKQYLCAENGGGTLVAANRSSPESKNWETFELWAIPGTNKHLIQVSNGKFMGLDSESLVALSDVPGKLEAFEILQKGDDFTRVRIKAHNGKYLQAKKKDSVMADARDSTPDAKKWNEWGDDDPSVFLLTIVRATLPKTETIKAIEGASQKLKGSPPKDLPPPPPPPTLPSPEEKDGIRVQLKSVTQQKYLHAEKGGGTTIVANKTKALRGETFQLQRVTEIAFQIQAFNGRFIGLGKQGKGINVMVNSKTPKKWDMFEFTRIAQNPTHIRIKAPNGSFLQAKTDGSVTADFPTNRKWESNDASVFSISTVTQEEWENIVSRSNNEEEDSKPISSVRAVNLGGWLVVDGSITPRLFDGIPSKDLLDGTEVQLKSVLLQEYLSAQHGGGANIIANASDAGDSETFKLWRISDTTFQFRTCKGQFIGLEMQQEDSTLVAISNSPGILETFELRWDTEDTMLVSIKSHDGRFLQVNRDGKVQANHLSSSGTSCLCRDNDPTLFQMTIVSSLRGEFQLVNGYGTKKAAEIIKDHRESFIREEDFESISEHGLDAVRIPVGWWIASDPNPPRPFVGGSLAALDNAFSWAENYGLRVIVSLYAAPGSQNGLEQSGSRDSFQSWGKTDESIDRTVEVIDFLSARYANSPNLVAIELLDKPMAPEITLESLVKYYKKGYDAVRNYSSSTYVIMSNRLYSNSKELLEFASTLKRSVINVHYYDFFAGTDNAGLADELRALTVPNGPLIFIGEWTAKWQGTARLRMSGADYHRISKEKLETLGQAKFGWAYWTLKTDEKRGGGTGWQRWANLLKETSLP